MQLIVVHQSMSFDYWMNVETAYRQQPSHRMTRVDEDARQLVVDVTAPRDWDPQRGRAANKPRKRLSEGFRGTCAG
jgi:hypothetical protein